MTNWQKAVLWVLSIAATVLAVVLALSLQGCAVRPSQREIEAGIKRIKDGNDR